MLAHKDDLGYGLLVKKYASDLSKATPEDVRKAAHDTVPKVAPLFWTFRDGIARVHLYCIFCLCILASANNVIHEKKRFLRFALWLLPTPDCHEFWLVCR